MPTEYPAIPSSRNLAHCHPTGNHFNWLAKRQVGNAIAIAAERFAHGRLLDIGCGEKPYRDTFASHVTEHVGVDHPESPHALTSVDVLATADAIPVDDRSFDTALMSEVLEHLEEPLKALREAYRVLKPGGHIIATSPFVWVLHEEPRDFYRYSPFGLQWLLEAAGFEVVEIAPLGGQWTTLALLTSYVLSSLPRPARPVARVVASGLQHVAWRLDRLQWRPWMAWNHLAVASRPADVPNG
jgi:SAM-dependent methyltransferase